MDEPPAPRSAAWCPRKARRLQPRHPDRDLRLHRRRRAPPLHLQPVAAGAGVLRRHLVGLTATPAKHTFGFFNQNLVMEYPRHGGRWRTASTWTTRLPHPHPGERSRWQSRRRLLHRLPRQAHTQDPLGRTGRGVRLAARGRLGTKVPYGGRASFQQLSKGISIAVGSFEGNCLFL